MNKVYRLIPRNYNKPDCFEGFIVSAPNEKIAIKLATNELFYKELQTPFSAEEIDLNKTEVLLSAYNNG